MKRQSIESVVASELVVGFEGPVAPPVSFQLKKGDLLSLEGPSGGGKSTLLRTLSGLILPLEGRLLLNGSDVSEYSFEEFLPLRLNVGVSFDLGGLLNNRTLWDNLMLPLLYHKLFNFDEAEARADRLMSAFGLARYLNERPSNVPGGIRKAACVARAFVLDPELVILDEPTTGLNSEGLRALDFEMARLKRRGTIVVFANRDEGFRRKWATGILSLDSYQACWREASEGEVA